MATLWHIFDVVDEGETREVQQEYQDVDKRFQIIFATGLHKLKCCLACEQHGSFELCLLALLDVLAILVHVRGHEAEVNQAQFVVNQIAEVET